MKRRPQRSGFDRLPGAEQCRAKLAWRTETQARNAIVRLQRCLRSADVPVNPLRPYACTVCGRWHLTKQGAEP